MNTLPIYTMISVLLVPLAGFVDSTSPLPIYSGSWLTDTNLTYAIGGSARYTNDVGSTINFDVYSNGFTLFFLYQSGGGSADVCIESDCVSVSSDGAVSSGRADFSGLSSGLKNVSIEVTNSPFYFDGLYIHPDSEQPDTSVLFSEFSSGGTDYTAQYHFSFTAGEVATVVLLAMLIIVQTSNLVMWLWHRQ